MWHSVGSWRSFVCCSWVEGMKRLLASKSINPVLHRKGVKSEVRTIIVNNKSVTQRTGCLWISLSFCRYKRGPVFHSAAPGLLVFRPSDCCWPLSACQPPPNALTPQVTALWLLHPSRSRWMLTSHNVFIAHISSEAPTEPEKSSRLVFCPRTVFKTAESWTAAWRRGCSFVCRTSRMC